MSDKLIPVICFLVFLIPWEIIEVCMQRYYSRKCGYDCSRCRYWPCPVRECEQRRKGGDSQ